MNKFLKVAVLLGGTFTASCFAAGSGTPVADSNASVALEQLKVQSAETNALLKQLVKQNAAASEQQKSACYFEGKLYTQGSVVDGGKQFCGEENHEPKIRMLEQK